MKCIGIVAFRYEARDFNKYLHKSASDYKKASWSNVEKYAEEFNKSRMEEIASIANSVSENEVSYVLFPGNTLIVNDDIWNQEDYVRDLKVFRELFDNTSIIMELRYFDKKINQYYPPVDTGTICLESGKEVGERIQQIFAESGGYSKNFMISMYKRFWAENIWGHRIKDLNGIKFLIWVCGEINFLRCPQKADEDPVARFAFNDTVPDPLADLQYDVFFNPVHSPMKRLHLIRRKLAYLSRKSKLAIQTTNIPSFRKSIMSAFLCYKNGQELPKSKIKTIEHSRWVMNIIDI